MSKLITNNENKSNNSDFNSNKQIEEMARILRHSAICYTCRHSINGNERRDWRCHRPSNLDCRHDEDVLKTCEALHNAGYRKATEVAREIFEEIEKITLDGMIGGRYPTKVINPDKYTELKEKYTEG